MRTLFDGVLGRALNRATALLVAAALAVTAVVPAQAQGRQISLIRDSEIENALWDWTRPILKAAGVDPASVKIYVVNDQSLNAFVSGGQNIFFHTGLITEVKDVNELIGVIAHETGHISGGHLTRGSDAAANAAIPLIISMIAGVAIAAAGAPDVGMGAIAGGQTIAQRSFFVFTRAQESAADQAGLKFLTATGRSARGMLSLFGRMQSEDILSGRNMDPYARTHPLSRERLAALQAGVERSPYVDAPPALRDVRRFQLIQGKILGYMERPDIVMRRFPRTDQSERARYARAVAHFRSANFRPAMAETESLIAADPSNPYFHELKGQLLVEMSRPRDGIAPFARAVELAPRAALIRVGYASAMLATEDPSLTDEAVAELKTALSSDSENIHGWRQLAMAYDRLNQPGDALLSTAESYFAVRAYGPAGQFAGRAQQQLQPGTIAYRRATDIMAIAQNEAPNERRRR